MSALLFQLVAADAVAGATVRLTGRAAGGESVVVRVTGFRPYFFVSPYAGQAAAIDRATSVREDASVTRGMDHFNDARRFGRVECKEPRDVPAARASAAAQGFGVYEADVPFALRFLIDKGIEGASWVRVALPAGRPVRGPRVAVTVDESAVGLPTPDEARALPPLAPLGVLSVDIECMPAQDGSFPKPERDRVIQIAAVYARAGRLATPDRKVVLCLDGAAPLPGAEIVACATERDLLQRWAALLQELDPDVVTGYNVRGFDLPYLAQRHERVCGARSLLWGRDAPTAPPALAALRKENFRSQQSGVREDLVVDVPGRVVLDVLLRVRESHKLPRYSLNNVAAHILNDQKEDVPYESIAGLFRGTPEDRRRLASYCLHDAVLPLRLCDKLMLVPGVVELSRANGVCPTDILDRGQQVRVFSRVLRCARPRGFAMRTDLGRTAEPPPAAASSSSSSDSDGNDRPRKRACWLRGRAKPKPGARGRRTAGYQGATVLDPVRGFYGPDEPVVTMDFASLYPSIMCAHNMCYTTRLAPGQAVPEGVEVDTCPGTGARFVTRATHVGLLPTVLEELVAARKRTRALLAAVRGDGPEAELERAVLDARQLALKVTCNSVYGFTGAEVGRGYCLDISASVTAWGRQMIELTRDECVRRWGASRGARVIYGDTDSVMVVFPGATVAELFAFGPAAAEELTALFTPPVKLEFEKVYSPYLLMNRKRYAGLKWVLPNHAKPKCVEAKGIECARRDHCGLVQRAMLGVLHRLLRLGDPAAAEAYARHVVEDLREGDVDMSELVVTRGLTRPPAEYANPGGLAHVALAARMARRDPGSAPRVGDRVPYVLVQPPSLGLTRACDRAEDPLYALEHDLPVDRRHYLLQSLAKPLARLLGPIVEQARRGTAADVPRLLGALQPPRCGQTRAGTGALVGVVARARCAAAGCACPVDGAGDALCSACAADPERADSAWCAATAAAHRAAAERDAAWDGCLQCQRSLLKDPRCEARDCPVFYARQRLRVDAERRAACVERLGAQLARLDW